MTGSLPQKCREVSKMFGQLANVLDRNRFSADLEKNFTDMLTAFDAPLTDLVTQVNEMLELAKRHKSGK